MKSIGDKFENNTFLERSRCRRFGHRGGVHRGGVLEISNFKNFKPKILSRLPVEGKSLGRGLKCLGLSWSLVEVVLDLLGKDDDVVRK